MDLSGITVKRSLPHGGTVKVHHEPFGGVEGERLGILYPGNVGPELRANEGRPGVGSVDVHPHVLVGA